MISENMFYCVFLETINMSKTVWSCHIALLLIDQKETFIDTHLEDSTDWFVSFTYFLREW